jgi:hypothetical protein
MNTLRIYNLTSSLFAVETSHHDHSLKSLQKSIRSQPMVTGMKLLKSPTQRSAASPIDQPRT